MDSQPFPVDYVLLDDNTSTIPETAIHLEEVSSEDYCLSRQRPPPSFLAIQIKTTNGTSR